MTNKEAETITEMNHKITRTGTKMNPRTEMNPSIYTRIGNHPSITRHRPNRRPRFFDVVSSRHLTSRTKRYFVRLFVRPQVERRDDRCRLWISTNSIVSICTTSSKSTKIFGRCRVFSYFQYIILYVTGYRWKRSADDMIPVTESWDMLFSIQHCHLTQHCPLKLHHPWYNLLLM